MFNGLVLRTVKDKEVDANDPDIVLPPPKLPVGVIPGGSTDTVAYSLHGTTDVQTAAIHIIFGDSTGLDLSSIHSDRSLLRLYASVLSYGYLGDVMKDSEKFRWMGPQRYDYSGKRPNPDHISTILNADLLQDSKRYSRTRDTRVKSTCYQTLVTPQQAQSARRIAPGASNTSFKTIPTRKYPVSLRIL